MGKTKAVKRKQTLLKETRKPVGYKFGSPLENLDFSKPPTAKVTDGASTSSEDNKDASEMESKKLANFLEDMSSLADGSDQGSPSTGLANGTAPGTAEPGQPVAASKEEPAPEAATASQEKVTFWQKVWDDNTSRHYYWNPSSNEVLWELPPGGVEMSQNAGEEESTAMEEVEELMENYPYVKQEIKPVAKTEEESGTVASSAEKAVESKGKGDSPVAAQEEQAAKPGKKRKAAATAEEEPVRTVSATASSTSSSSAESLAKKPRLGKAPVESGEDTPSPSRKKTAAGGSSSGNKQAEQMMRVSNIADQFSRKLEYLHVSTQKLSSFERLAIQLQTRLDDWKDGSLPTKNMLAKLKVMNEELSRCESTAAPEGWKYVWDSSTCRYQFLNTTTGLLTWEPPVQGPFSSDEADPQDSEAEPEIAAPEEKTDDIASATDAAAPFKEEDEKMETAVVQGPSLPRQVQSTTEPSPAKDEEPSVPADNLYCISEPTPDQDPVVEKKEPEVPKKPYLGPTADYLSSTKEEGPVPVVSMPPPRHVAKKLLAIQKQKEEKERLAQIERESRPMTSRDVRQKFLSKLPLWKQKQLAKERASEEKQAQLESAAAEEASQKQELTLYPPPDEDVEEISQYPPPGEPIEQYPPPTAAEKEPVTQYPPPVEKREPVTSTPQRSHLVQAPEEQLVKYPILSQRHGEGFKPITASVSSAGPTPAPVPPSHHMQTGELQYSRDPLVARQQKELYMPGSSQSPPQSAAQKEVKLREKLVHRVQSFKIGKSQDSEASKTASGEERMEVEREGVSVTTRQIEAVPSSSSAAAADELVVESTGEKQQQQQQEEASASLQPQFDPQQQSPMVGHSPQVANTSFQGSEAREPETGIMEGEPGEILDDSNVEPEDMGMAEGRGGLEEGEMGEEEEEEETRSKFPVGGKCYMDMEKEKDDVVDKSDLSADDSEDSPAPKRSKERKYSYSRSPDPGYRSKHSKKKARRRRETDSEEDERYSESGYMKKGSEYKKRYSHQRGRSSKHHHHHSRSRDYYQGGPKEYYGGPKEYYQGGPKEYYEGESESEEYYYASSKKRRGGGGGRARERSYSPEEYRPSRKSGKSSRRYGSSRQRSRSRSHSYDSDHMMEREKRKSGSSGKHKKKEKKKKRRRSSSRNRDGSGDDKPAKAPPPNVLVGKVGKISTVRALGQEKKPDDTETKATASDANTAQGAAPNMGMADPMAMRNLDPQQMSATYYQQPSTGQIPYYGTYPAYQYPYTQDVYVQPPPPPPEQQQPQQAKWQWGDADPAQWAAKNAANLAAEESQDSSAPAAEGETEGNQESVSASQTTGEALESQGVESAPEMVDGTATAAEVQEQPLYPADLPAAKENTMSQDVTAGSVAPPTTSQDESVTQETSVNIAAQDKDVVTSPAQDVVVPPPPVSQDKPVAPSTGRVLRSSRRSRWSDREVTESGCSMSQATVATSTTTVSPAGAQQIMTTDTVTTMAHPAPIPTAPSPAGTTLSPPPLPSEPEVSKPPVPAPPPAEEEVNFVPPEPVAMESAPVLPPPPVAASPVPPPVAMETSSPVPPAAAPPAPVAAEGVTTPFVQPSPPVAPEPVPVTEVTPPLPPPTAEGDASKPSAQDPAEESAVEMEIESDHNSPAPGPPPTDCIKGESEETVLPEKEKQGEGVEGKQEGGVAVTDSTEELYSFAQPISEALGKMETSAEGTQQQEATPSQEPASTVASETPPVSAATTYYQPNYAASAAATTYSPQQQAYSYAYAQNYNYAQAAYMQQAAAYGAYGMQPAQYYYGGAAYGSYPTATPGYYGAYGAATYPAAVSAPSQVPVSPAASSTTTTDPAGKKGDFSLAGNKEKQLKSMMDKWNAFKDDKM